MLAQRVVAQLTLLQGDRIQLLQASGLRPLHHRAHSRDLHIVTLVLIPLVTQELIILIAGQHHRLEIRSVFLLM